MMSVGCPDCCNKELADEACEEVKKLSKKYRKHVVLAILFLILETLVFVGVWKLEKATETHSRQICFNLTGSPDAVYVNDKCYLPNEHGDLQFITDLSKI